jgi:four helix bundle protein
MRNFKELNVWKKSHQMAIEVYCITRAFPADERFGLVTQLRRSAASVPANIAEGCGRNGDRDFSRFLSIAAGSASETEYHILLAYDLHFMEKNVYLELDQQINGLKGC